MFFFWAFLGKKNYFLQISYLFLDHRVQSSVHVASHALGISADVEIPAGRYQAPDVCRLGGGVLMHKFRRELRSMQKIKNKK